VRTPTGQLTTNRWNNIVVTYSGNSLETGVRFYRNSNLQPNIVGSSNLTNTILTSANVNIGARAANTVSPAHLNGRIAQTLIYNRALTQAEVLQNYNATKARFGL
jgi:glycerol uptake facilitator-like aquaporin